MYSKKLLQHFRHPHNYGRMKNPDGVGKAGNPICGDVLFIYIKVEDGRLADIKFETLGCAAALGTSSMITDLAKGKTLKQAMKISNRNVADAVGGLPAIKMHCSNLAADALRAAIQDYLERQGLKNKKT